MEEVDLLEQAIDLTKWEGQRNKTNKNGGRSPRDKRITSFQTFAAKSLIRAPRGDGACSVMPQVTLPLSVPDVAAL